MTHRFRHQFFRSAALLASIGIAALCGGCAVVSVASTTVGVATTAVGVAATGAGLAVDAAVGTAKVVGGAVSAVTPGSSN